MITNRPVVVFTDDTASPEGAALLQETCDVRILPGAYPSEAVLIAACRDANAIFARLGDVTKGVIDAAPNLSIISRHGIGVDSVDLDAATKRGVIVTTTGTANADAVAEYTTGLLLALARSIPRADREMREGQWNRPPLIGLELKGGTMGIIGYGNIGSRVARHALGLGMKVIACDPYIDPPKDPDIPLVPLEELLRQADVVSIHLRLTPETHHILAAPQFAQMKPTAVVVNTARGECISGKALYDALTTGQIAGAALDTFEEEPLPADSPMRTLPNLLLSPHVAGQTKAALVNVALMAAHAILDDFAGRRPDLVYNPEAYDYR
jgi:D-3-phosphoglycerate dehydrogenase / 2-oxoglutarate reductase